MNLKYTNISPYLFIIFLIGCITRLYQLTKQSLWLDEVFTLNVSQLTFTQIWNFTTSGFDVHPPLFYWIEHISTLIFNLTPFSLRIFPAIFGICTMPVFYYIGKELYNEKFGLVLSLLLAISPFHIFHSQDARMYSLFLFVFSISCLYLIKHIKTKKITPLLISSIFLAICCYIHFMSFVLSAIGVYTLLLVYYIDEKEKLKHLLYHFISCTIIILPIIPSMITTMFLNKSNPFYIESGRSVSFYGIDVITRTFAQLSGSSIPLTMGIFVLSLIGVYTILTNFDIFTKKLVLAPISAIGLIVIPLSYKIQIEPRYFIFMILPLLCIASYGLLQVVSQLRARYEKLNKNTIFAILMIIIILIHIPALTFHYTSYTKPDWNGVSQEISYISYDKDIVVLLPGGNQKLFELYYTGKTIYINSVSELSKIPPNERVIILVPGDIKYDQNKEKYTNWIEDNTKPIKHYDTFDIYEMIKS